MAQLTIQSRLGGFSEQTYYDLTIKLEGHTTKQDFDDLQAAIATIDRIVTARREEEPGGQQTE